MGVPSTCALLGRFGARVSLLQHNAEREMSASACTRSMPVSFFIHHWNSEEEALLPLRRFSNVDHYPQN